ncbi:MAG TPA: hypothetical protein VIF37_02035 [Methylobacter sp.]|jgi:hypothetical protein
MLQILTILFSVFLLSACSTMPSGPSVLVLPGTGKNFDQFHNDDLMCRQLSHTHISTLQKQTDSTEESQHNYDIIYIQCMYGKGHRVPVPRELSSDTLSIPNMPVPPQMTTPGSVVNPLQ